MTFLSNFTRRFKEIAAVANVRKPVPNDSNGAKPGQNAKPDLAKAALDKPARTSNGLPPTIKAANEAINALPPVTHRKTGKAGIDLMHAFEGCEKKRPDGRFEAYLCPAKVWTIGWGATGADPFNGGKIGRGTVWTQAQCDMRFEQHLATFEQAVRQALGKAPASQGQFDAFVSFAYNLGGGALAGSTLMRLHKAGDFDGAAKQFLRWNKAGGVVLRGLTRRRTAEAALYKAGSQ